ncbi:acyl carrier protein [Streptomyces sp. NPDC059070]|uniref:acyl carrier protein n=1 Tax=unclassified Streptomyces TaxID=2593676 RepID=UPI0034E1999D
MTDRPDVPEVPDVLHQVLTAAAAVFECEVGPCDGFFSLGGDSVMAVELATVLEELLDTEVHMETVVDADDFGALAAALAADAPRATAPEAARR